MKWKRSLTGKIAASGAVLGLLVLYTLHWISAPVYAALTMVVLLCFWRFSPKDDNRQRGA
ncbi:MAG TPA: hypothetical protein IAC21_02550 [Candidatus Enterenecus merdae]|nr:hypothetical protein [Candidatus Enterenecus merdae]